MSPTKSRGQKQHMKPPVKRKRPKVSPEGLDLSNVSVTDKGCFLEVLELQYGNPLLHSTALEDGLEEEHQDRGGGGAKGRGGGTKGGAGPEKPRDSDQGGGRVQERKPTEMMSSNSVDMQRSALDKKLLPPVSSRPAPTASKRLVGKKPARKRTAGQASRPAHKQCWDPAPTNESGSQSLKAGPKKSTAPGSGSTTRISSGGSPSEKENEVQPTRRRRATAPSGDAQSDVLLQALQEFCTRYRENVESQEVQESIDVLCQHVRDWVSEKVSASKELRALRRANAKTRRVIHHKMQRLLEAKRELLKAELKVQQQQKEQQELTERLADLRRGPALLRELRELTDRSLQHQHQQQDHGETYGAPSLPALLWEVRHTTAADPQPGKSFRLSAQKRRSTAPRKAL